jgi:hypothetical protein
LVDAKAQHTIFACHVFLWQSVVHAAMSASRATLVSSAQTYVTRRVHEIKKKNCASTMTYIYTVHPSVSVLVTLTVFQVFSTFHMNFHLHFVVHLKRRRSATQLSHECQDGKSWILEIVLADVHKCFVNVFTKPSRFAGRYSVQHFFVNHACGIPNQA